MKTASPEDDLLSEGPALPKLSNARPGSESAPILPASGSASPGMLAMLGGQPAVEVLQGMAAIEDQIQKISKHIPSFATAANPFIIQMKDLAAAALADLAQGGTGAVSLGADAAPPPMPGAAPAAPPMGGPMGAAGPMPPLPPPPM